MTKTELIQQLRALTSAPMKSCVEALEEAQGDLQKAIDVIKIKGQNIASGNSKVAAEGVVAVASSYDDKIKVLLEINSNTDFVANSEEFKQFSRHAAHMLLQRSMFDETFSINDIEGSRQELAGKTKENIVVRRWWVEQAFGPTSRVFSYVHSNNKIGVLLTMMAPSLELVNDKSFIDLGNDIAMQIAAMAPIAVSSDRLSPEIVEREKTIFETQLKELNKPQAAWPKIMEGKTARWHKDVCLLNQESVMVPKTTVRQLIDKVSPKIEVVNFIRCMVGEGIETEHKNFADEVAQLSGV